MVDLSNRNYIPYEVGIETTSVLSHVHLLLPTSSNKYDPLFLLSFTGQTYYSLQSQDNKQ
jgi:hypothetical protein